MRAKLGAIVGKITLAGAVGDPAEIIERGNGGIRLYDRWACDHVRGAGHRARRTTPGGHARLQGKAMLRALVKGFVVVFIASETV